MDDAPATNPIREIEITPEMVEAGLAEYYALSPLLHLETRIVERIYRRMEAVRRGSPVSDAKTSGSAA